MPPTARKHPQRLLDYLEGVTTSAGVADKLVGDFTGVAFADLAAGVALATGDFAADTLTILGATTGATDALPLAVITLATGALATGALATGGAGVGATTGDADFAVATLVAGTLAEVIA